MQKIKVLLLLAFIATSTFVHAQDTTRPLQNRNVEIGIRSSNYSGYGIFYSLDYSTFKPRITVGYWDSSILDGYDFTSQTSYSVGMDVSFPVYSSQRFEYCISVGAMYDYQIKHDWGDMWPFDTVQVHTTSHYYYKNIRSGLVSSVGLSLGRFRFRGEIGISFTFTHAKTIWGFWNPSERRVVEETPFGKPTFDVGYGLSIGYVF